MASILHVVNTYFAVPYFIGEQFLYFMDKGHELHLICPESEFLEQYSLDMKFKYKTVEITRTYTLFKDIKALFIIYGYIKSNKIEIVVGHTPKGALLAMFAGWLRKTPVRIYFRHGLVYETRRGLARRILIMAERISAYFSTLIICVSPSIARVSLRDNLNPSGKQTILGRGTCGGIDTRKIFNPGVIRQKDLMVLKEQYKISAGDVVIGFCGRIVPDKGIIELIDSLDILRSRNPGIRFIIMLVGILENRDRLPKPTLDKMKYDRDIILTGYVRENINYFYSMMNIYVLPSFREGFGMSVIEASAMEIPVLTTRATGCVDAIVENVTGRYILNNPQSIAEGIEFYVKNPESALSAGKAGREFVRQNFDNLMLWMELENYYR
ncbi:MAG TPA: glycosyltransferase [Bacteroidales bacterium]|nr:glycosyltransferase [Bacteroidales bacterium]HPF03752.1 glycosyltransferase [Bacteroidales bacterium]HPJ58586.1 glycosyltransferase [Bacteroidales bacterium]HPR11255.1 glycosyltransferase [Bacteroidales bacterium]